MLSTRDLIVPSFAEFGTFSHSASQAMNRFVDAKAVAPLPVARDVLIIEDNYLIALDLEAMVRELGVEHVRSANSVHAALELIEAQRPQLALIDVNLGTDKSFEVAGYLRGMQVPIVFTTGYGDAQAFPQHFADAKIITKPYTLEAVREAIAKP